MKKIWILFCTVMLLYILPTAGVLANADGVKEDGEFAIDEIIWNECTGEDVHVTGKMIWRNQYFSTESGTYHWGFLNRYQGVSGVGLTSGTVYRVIDGEHGYGSLVEDPDHPYHYAAGRIDQLRMISQGSLPDLVMVNQVVVTVSPGSGYKVEIYKTEFKCK